MAASTSVASAAASMHSKLTESILTAEHRKALFLAVFQICVVAHFPLSALGGAGLFCALPKVGSAVCGAVDPALNFLVHKARSSILLTLSLACVAAFVGKQFVVLELIVAPELVAMELFEGTMMYLLVWPLFMALAFYVGLRMCSLNAAALPTARPKEKVQEKEKETEKDK